MTSIEKWAVAVGDTHTSAELDSPDRPTGTVFVCAHGAGGNMNDRGMLGVTKELARRGLNVVRFNFLYKEKKTGRPDPMPLLQTCYAAVVQQVRDQLKPETLIIGGRSMGGRVASMLAADGFECAGLLLLAYPLHPDGKPEQLRDAHLPNIRVPVLCFNGTRDSMCTPHLMERVLERVCSAWQMHWLDDADHSFHVLRRSGRTDADVTTEVANVASAWVAALAAAPRSA